MTVHTVRAKAAGNGDNIEWWERRSFPP